MLNSTDDYKEKILGRSLYDKIMDGGLGYGSFCMPKIIFKIIFTVLFPPIGIIINNIGKLKNNFPYITTDNFINIIKKIDQVLISFILTMLFYIPGLIYTLSKFKKEEYDNLIKEEEDNETKDDFDNTENIDDNDLDNEDDEFKNIDLNKLRKELLENK